MMMGENLINQLLIRLDRQDIEYYIDTDQPVHIERLKVATEHSLIYSDQIELKPLWTRRIRYVRYLEKRLRKTSVLRYLASFYDAVIILGGDDYAETYYALPKDDLLIRSIFKDLCYLGKRTQVFMLGQTIGPFTGKRIRYAQKGLKEMSIYVRDHQSQLYLEQDLQVPSVLSTDLAFLDLHLQHDYQNRYQEILQNRGLDDKQYLTLVGTGLISHYMSKPDGFIEVFLALIDHLNQRFPDYKIVLLSHVSNKESTYSDNTFIDLLEKRRPGALRKQCVIISEPMLPTEARILLGHGALTISCRMHAAVSTFQMGTPAICLSYSKKFAGVIGENLKCPELVIQAKGDAFWENDPVSVIMERVEYTIEHQADLMHRIANEVRANKAVLDQTLSDLTTYFKDKKQS
jgi:colanic acid/amylovoran biosynthesis protein